MSDSLLTMFEGLSKEQAKALRERILPTISELRREIINPGNGNNSKGVTMSNDNIFEGLELDKLSEEESAQVMNDLKASAARVRAERLKPLIAEYKQAFLAVPRGVTGNAARAQIKAKYRAQGVPVDSVDFS